MPAVAMFSGFDREAIQFLVDLAANNDRAWFQPRKADYERLLKDPLEALCAAVDLRFRALDLPFNADPARSPFRIYRDVRFSRDKSPYKTHISASFPWAGDGEGVGGYFHLAPGEIFVGGGMWHPERSRLAAWRHRVDTEPETVHAALEDPGFVRTFGSLDGDRLSRVPQGFARDHPDADLLRLKDMTFGRRLSDAEAASSDLPETVATSLADAVPVLRLLATLPVESAADEPGWLRGHGSRQRGGSPIDGAPQG